MTTLDTTRSTAGTSGLVASITGFIGTLAAWNDARITRRSLSKLSARELDDIGLCYGDIENIAVRGTRR